MFLPIGDEPNPPKQAWVTYGLIAANVVVFLLLTLPLGMQGIDPRDPWLNQELREIIRTQPDAGSAALEALRGMSAYDVFVMRWGYRPGAPSLTTLLTSMFLHGGFAHLAGNMLFLWIYGDNVEYRLGRGLYILAYLGGGALATLGYAALAPATAAQIPLVGASGAISAVLGFYFVWFPRNRVRILVVLLPFYFDVWRVGARWVLGMYLLVDNLLPFLLTTGGGGGVAHGAHLGGFVAGAAGALLGRRSLQDFARPVESSRPQRSHVAVSDSPSGGAPSDTELGIYLALPSEARRVVPEERVLLAAERAARAGLPDAALAAYFQLLQDHPQGRELDRTLLGIGLVLLRNKRQPELARRWLENVLAAQPRPAVARAAQAALLECPPNARNPAS